ncbi:hypothetical protein CRG98_042278 [Punica granatum]|uniref:Integrase catalytic domain-containing protein n=1 Tax=Punica granatum TaxID=22663 RepID=A0A2I0I1H5_PUNGR|nr:hypothetical protein CRG98_042278 [Punica granatum]
MARFLRRDVIARYGVPATIITDNAKNLNNKDFASPDFASSYCFPDSASTLLLSGLRVPGLCVRLLLSGLRVHFTAFRTSRPRTLRPVTAFRTPRPLYRFPDFESTFTAFRTSRPRTSRPFDCFLRALALHLPLHIPQVSLTLLSHDGGRDELPQRTTMEAAAGTKKGASHCLWLHPLTEHATKEGQAVSTPFWSTGFLHEEFRPRLGTLFITRQSEANRQARGHEQREKS